MSPTSGNNTFKPAPMPREAASLRLVAGTARRRGSVLVLVIGVLALLAIIVVVYTAVGQADVRTAASLVQKTRNEDQSRAVGSYITQIIGDNSTATYFQRDAATGVRRVTRQAFDYPSTDPETRSVRASAGGGPPAITSDEQWRAQKFTPTGTQRYYWPTDTDPARQDPRISSDPWLASTEPVWINRTAQTLSQPSDLAVRMTDWLHMSVISPDGRAVNLANLRGNLGAGSGFGNDNGLPRMSQNLFKLRAPNNPGEAPVIDTSLTSTDDLYNAPSTWATNGLGLYHHVNDINGAAPLPSNVQALSNMFADADGDGYYDSFWQELVDASDAGAPVNILGGSGLRLFVAPRIIDLSGLVNVNTAVSFADPFSSRGSTTTTGLEVKDPTLPKDPNSPVSTAFRAAPVRYRTTFSEVQELSSRKYYIEAPPGATPADVDLERLLTGFDAVRYLGRNPIDYFGPGASGPYNALAGLGVQQFTETLAETGGSAFSSFMATRGTGQASLPQAAGFVQTAPGVPYPFFAPGQLAYSTFEYDRGLSIFGPPVPPGLTFPNQDQQVAYNEAQAERTLIERYRLFVTPMDRKGLYARVASGNGTEFERVVNTTNNGEMLQYQTTSGVSLMDESELRRYNGVNDVAFTSPLEATLDFRNLDALRTAGSTGPLRSNRSLFEERDAGAGIPNSRGSMLAARFADPRRLLTTISGARPLTMVSEKFRNASGASTNTTLSQELPITQRDVRLDLQEAIARALPGLGRDSSNNLVDTGDVLAANEIFLAYAEAMIPLADMQHDTDARGNGFDLWDDQANANSRRTSASMFGAAQYTTGTTGSIERREIPRQNAELSLRAAAHMTLNMLAWRDPSDRPIAATLLLNEQFRNELPRRGTGAQPGRIYNNVPAFPYWTETVGALDNSGSQWTFGLDFDSQALRPDRQDLNRNNNTTERMTRLANTGITPDEAPKAVNLFAIRPEPVVTQLQSFTVYTDAVRPAAAEVLTDASPEAAGGFTDRAQVEDVLRKKDNEFEFARVTISGTAEEVPGEIKIDGRVRENNPDFLFEMVAIQITNPFDVPINLSGTREDGTELVEPVYTPAGVQGLRNSDQLAGVQDGFINPLNPSTVQTRTDTDLIDRNQNERTFSYYIEFGGRFYRLADYTWEPSGTNNGASDSSLVGRPVILQPRQSRVFYVLGQNPNAIATRISDASRESVETREFMEWVNNQLWQKFSYVRAAGAFPSSEAPEVALRVGDGAENRPVRLLPFDRKTGELRARAGGTLGVGVIYPQVDAQSRDDGKQLIAREADNSSVKLWRAVRVDMPGLDEVSAGRANEPGNDILVDRLVDPVLSYAQAGSRTLASAERRLGMTPSSDSSNGVADIRFGDFEFVAGTAGQADRSGDNTGFSVVMTGGFRRADDPGAWVDLDSSNTTTKDYRGPGGGPAPIGFTNTYPRGVLPAWAIETPLLKSTSQPVASPSSSNWWTRGMPSDPANRSRNTNYFMLGHPLLLGEVKGSLFAKRLFEPGPFVAESATEAQTRPAYTATQLVGASNALFLTGTAGQFRSSVVSEDGIPRRNDIVPAPIVTEIAAHPSDKYRQLELVRKELRVAFGSATSTIGRAQDDAITLIDQSNRDEGAEPKVNLVSGQATVEFPVVDATGSDPGTGTVGFNGQRKNFDQLYTVLPQFPKGGTPKEVGGVLGVAESPIVPELRPTDVLLPWAIGPSQSPRDAGSDARLVHLADEWVTLSEAAGQAFDYAPREQVVTPDQAWSVALGVVLDRGRLRLNQAPVPFNDPRGDYAFPGPNAVTNVVPPIDRGVPVAMAIVDKFRTMREGGATTPVYGTVNINTAPLNVLRMLPMATAMDVNRGNGATGPLHSWMTHGLVPNLGTDGLGSANQEQQDGPMNSAGVLALNRDVSPVFDSRAVLRNKPDSVWDLAASIAAYRDKNAVLTMPSFNGSNRYLVDFAEANRTDVTLNANVRYDDNGRRYQSEIEGLREEPGFHSIGELLAVRVRPTPRSGAVSRTVLPVPTVADEVRDMPVAAQLSIDRFARDLQPADYIFQRRTRSSVGGLINVDPELQVPLALSAMMTPEPLRPAFLQNFPAPFNRPVGWRQGEVTADPARAAVTPYVDPATMANLKPASVKDEYEENLLVANALLNTVSVRSDIFCAYFVLQGYQQSDVEGLTRDNTGPGAEQPMVPTLKRRYMMVVDRSNVVQAGDKPKVLLFQELPME